MARVKIEVNGSITIQEWRPTLRLLKTLSPVKHERILRQPFPAQSRRVLYPYTFKSNTA